MEQFELEELLRGTVVIVNKSCTLVSEHRLEIMLLLLRHMLLDVSPEQLREMVLREKGDQ